MAARLRFAEFELDLEAYTLWRGGERVRLQRIPMELLTQLVTARGTLVDRARIQAGLWGAEVFVDQEAAINTAIRKLRKALGDRPERPRFIETVVGKGYRFVAPVHAVIGDAAVVARPAFPKYVVRHAGQEFALAEGDNLVGRDPDACVYIDHPSVSRRHAVIRIGREHALIEDLRSRNGTFVDGCRVDQRTELQQGAVISAGPITLTFHAIAAPPSTKPMTGARRVTS
jgi:DNA-binding winged helix-turn-helix (wHTH) protein